MSALRKWFYKLSYALQKWHRKPLEVSIAEHTLNWVFDRGGEVQAKLYQAEYRPYMEHPHCFRHGSPVPYRETSPGHLECPFWQQHGPQLEEQNTAQLRPFELERIKQETLRREQMTGARVYQRLQEEGRTPSKSLTARLYPEPSPTFRKPPPLEWVPETQEIQAQKRGSGEQK